MENPPIGPTRLAAQPGSTGRESAAARRLRSFVSAATAFDCPLNESDFHQFFRAVACTGETSGKRSHLGGPWRPGGINPSSRTEAPAERTAPSSDMERAAASPHEALP